MNRGVSRSAWSCSAGNARGQPDGDQAGTVVHSPRCRLLGPGAAESSGDQRLRGLTVRVGVKVGIPGALQDEALNDRDQDL